MEYGPEQYNADVPKELTLAGMKRRTVRQELEIRKAEHQRIIEDINKALEALTPETEKLLDALRKVGI